MRKLLNPLLECDKICIEKIKLNLKSRDDIPVVLIALQHLYSQKDVRNELLMLLDKKMLVGVNKKGRTSRYSVVENTGIGCSQARPGLRL